MTPRVVRVTIIPTAVKAPDHPQVSVGIPAGLASHRFNRIAGGSLIVLTFFGLWWISIPLGWDGRTSARRTTAMSNAKQLAPGALAYANDADDHLPRASVWMDSLKPYVSKPSLVYPDNFEIRAGPAKVEPDKPKREQPEKVSEVFHSIGLKNWDVFGFAFRRHLSSRRLASIGDPSQVALVFDSSDTGWNANGGLDLIPSPGWYEKRGSANVNVIAFVDGHVKALVPGAPYIK